MPVDAPQDARDPRGEDRGRRFGKKLVIASLNPGKAREIAALLKPYRVDVVGAKELNLREPVESGATFAENAEIKARAAALASQMPALADDSGLEVAGLDGAPGVQSARWAGPERNFAVAMRRVIAELELRANPDRRARFVSALALCWPDGHCEVFEGAIEGRLVWPPRGDKGFGYDPIFVPEGHAETFGEMAPDRKQAISHRARAFRKLIDACFRD
jgi:XTP/dITP diphosphohydrolase